MDRVRNLVSLILIGTRSRERIYPISVIEHVRMSNPLRATRRAIVPDSDNDSDNDYVVVDDFE